MVCDLEATTFEDRAVWRIGHAPTPWRFTDWAHADQQGRFDGRWDDPEGSYRVLYASTSRKAVLEELFNVLPGHLAAIVGRLTDEVVASPKVTGSILPPGETPSGVSP